MTLVAAGVSHRTAAVEEREQLALTGEELVGVLRHLRAQFGNAAILSTCNRTEIYVNAHEIEVEPEDLLGEVAACKGRRAPLPAFYGLRDRDVPRHLFQVASGIDSMILGEGQILGQVREALSYGRQARSLDAALSRLLHAAIETGKRARHETDIGRFAVSVSSAAVALAREHVGALPDRRALVVGVGEAGKLAARALRDAGVTHMVVTSRTPSHAAVVAHDLHATTAPFDRLTEAIAAADLVVTSSSAPAYLITVERVRDALALGAGPLTFLDVAVPRDVDPTVTTLPGVRLFDIDDLQAVSGANLRLREAAAAEVRGIVEAAAVQFDHWIDTRRAAPTIAALVRQTDAIRTAEIVRTARDLGLDDASAEKLDFMTRAIVKKVLHAPIAYLKYTGDTEESAQRVRRIFGLEDE